MTSRRIASELTWLHLSDIHFGQGGAYSRAERDDVLAALVADLNRHRQSAPPPDIVILSGDVGHSGGALDVGEYEQARAFIERLRTSLALGHEAIYMVPGNHDVDRRVALRDDDVRRWLDEHRAGRPIDDSLASDKYRARLAARLASFQSLAKEYGVGFDRASDSMPLFWWADLEGRSGLKVRLAGANTALLCQDDQDDGHLQLGLSQLRAILGPQDPQRVSVLVTHHPLQWLRDITDIQPRVGAWADIHLCGHIHSADIRSIEISGGASLVTVTSGAIHEGVLPGLGRRQFGYSVMSLFLDSRGSAWVRIWPRKWSGRHAAFRVDIDTVADGRQHVDYRLSRLKTIGGRPSERRWEGRREVSLLRVEAERSIRRIGSRRTAYPLDMSIAELHIRGLFMPPRLRQYHEAAVGGPSMDFDELIGQAARGDNILVLGEPGAGKSVAAYGMLQPLSDSRIALALRLTEVREILETGSLLSDIAFLVNRVASLKQPPAMTFVVDGIDEAMGDFDSPVDIMRLFRGLASIGSIVVTCRRREFEDYLARTLSQDLFHYVYVVCDWNVDDEFRSFVDRLVEQNLLESDAVRQGVEHSAALQTLATRPLFARMLTYLDHQDLDSVRTVDALYAEYLDRLSTTSDVVLRSAGCPFDGLSQDMWIDSAWEIFASGLYLDEQFSVSAVASATGKRLSLEPRCISRALAHICDQWKVAGRVRGRFVHYSFFEYLVAQHCCRRIDNAVRQLDHRYLAEAFRYDLTPEIRHFLVARLRVSDIAGLAEHLALAYRDSSSLQLELSVRRTICNLIPYVMSRSTSPTDCAAPLWGLLNEESDLFLQQSLLWALCHVGDRAGLERFVTELSESSEWAAWNRGYLMYYYGDLDRRRDPPYVDDDPARSWARTRERSLNFFGAHDYERTISPHRRCIDLYTFYDYALWRRELISSAEAASALAALNKIDVDLVGDVVWNRLRAMHDAAAGQATVRK